MCSVCTQKFSLILRITHEEFYLVLYVRMCITISQIIKQTISPSISLNRLPSFHWATWCVTTTSKIGQLQKAACIHIRGMNADDFLLSNRRVVDTSNSRASLLFHSRYRPRMYISSMVRDPVGNV